LADLHDEHEAFKKKLAQKFEREAEGKPASLADRARVLLDAARGRDGGRPAETPGQAQSQAPARPTPAKDRER